MPTNIESSDSLNTNGMIWLSPPHINGNEQKYLQEAFDSNWIAPMGNNITGFEIDLQNYLSKEVQVAVLSSGTAAIHLALQLLGISNGDEVLCQSFTFCATANPIIYLGAEPIFIDSEKDTWNMAPELLEHAILNRIKKGKRPKAIIVVDIYGMPYKAKEINAIALKYEIPIIEDSAEALGSTYFGTKSGLLGDIGVLSFNGNKIITTSAGGALILKEQKQKEKTLYLATQARDINHKTHYQHSEIGYNYRMSNVLAGIGRGQMEVLEDRVSARRSNHRFYQDNLMVLPEIEFLEEPDGYMSNRWLTCVLTPSYEIRESIRLALLNERIESRRLWKPMHLQPVFENNLNFSDGTSEDLFNRGLCLPSGSNLLEEDLKRIISIIKTALS